MQGPAIFLAQFMADSAPFDSWANVCRWAGELGYAGLQVPSWDARCINLELAATSDAYCDELRGVAAEHGLTITELSTHLQGQLVAVHPAYDELFDAFAPEAVRGKPAARSAWAAEQVKLCLQASQRLGCAAMPSFTGALLWHTMYPWPQRPAGLVETGFAELAKRWKPLLDTAEECGVDIAWEVHPGEDVHDGATWERFLDALDGHPRANLLYDPSHLVLQAMDYVDFLTRYIDRVKCFHVKDAEFRPNGRVGAYGGYLPWADRAGRFRSLGDGEIDFGAIFSVFSQHRWQGWAVLEWECCFKDPGQGAREGVDFINAHMITPAAKSFDDFAGAAADEGRNRRILGI
ncbi:MAG: sugar phosphate isomerase/epimerase [Planctomycetota bacterium]|nr:MAG: sugar phosphate isomerase/epimerase [Planctomycetota bacterium]